MRRLVTHVVERPGVAFCPIEQRFFLVLETDWLKRKSLVAQRLCVNLASWSILLLIYGTKQIGISHSRTMMQITANECIDFCTFILIRNSLWMFKNIMCKHVRKPPLFECNFFSRKIKKLVFDNNYTGHVQCLYFDHVNELNAKIDNVQQTTSTSWILDLISCRLRIHVTIRNNHLFYPFSLIYFLNHTYIWIKSFFFQNITYFWVRFS